MDIGRACVVVTGASSGIGRATAEAFAARGARVVLAARRPAALEEVAAGIVGRGGTALAVPTDVTDAGAVEALADAALDAFGRIDVWISNAGVGVFGPFPDGGTDLHAKVIGTNLLGAVHGAAAALPVFRRQGRGVLIHLSSVGGFVPVPFAATYSASKSGLRAFGAALRQELADLESVHVCTVFPTFVDTPALTQHAANQSGRALASGRGAMAPEYVAKRLVRLAERPRPEVPIGFGSGLARLAYGLAPVTTERLMGFAIRRHLRKAERASRSEGAILAPVPQGTATRGPKPAGGRAAALAGTGLALGGLLLVAGVVAARR